ncbi:Clathrin/coatomer adaptor, adaptin-like protein [Sporodiniella umbellata]|nr:Clathrin/coatomer adaptor, adaptin-like protein [Sporodiniella umbellata]
MSSILFSSEFIASSNSHGFREFLTRLMKVTSKKEESDLVQKELSFLSSKLGNSISKKEYFARLIHCFMLGYSVDFSIIHAVMLTQSGQDTLDKRTGYLACSLFLQHDHELSIMLVNTLQQDLCSQNHWHQSIALNSLYYLYHPEIPESVIDLVLKAMDVPKQLVRKKAVMALYFLYEKYSMPLDRIESALIQALHDRDHSVVFAALSVWKKVLEKQGADILSVVYSIHQQIIQRKVPKSFTYHGVLAPWAQLDCLAIYQIYIEQRQSIPQDMLDVVIDCLNSVAKKVDAAYAIVLGCIKCLGAFPTQDIMNYLDPFLNSANHNLKYLGLLGLSFIESRFWKDEWGGVQLGKTILDFAEDDTIVYKALELLESIMSEGILRSILPDLLKGMAKNEKETNKILGPTVIQWANTHYVDKNEEYIAALLDVMVEFKKNADHALVQEQCQFIDLLLDEKGVTLQETVIAFACRLLKETSDDIYAPELTIFLFSVVGKYSYVSEQEDVEWMKLIQRWVSFLEDRESQIAGLAALKKIILRSRTWLSSLRKLLSKCSESVEKQELAEIMKDNTFKKEGCSPMASPKLSSSSRSSGRPIRSFSNHKADSERHLYGSFKEDMSDSKVSQFVSFQQQSLNIGCVR